jgi:hypothetical protein
LLPPDDPLTVNAMLAHQALDLTANRSLSTSPAADRSISEQQSAVLQSAPVQIALPNAENIQADFVTEEALRATPKIASAGRIQQTVSQIPIAVQTQTPARDHGASEFEPLGTPFTVHASKNADQSSRVSAQIEPAPIALPNVKFGPTPRRISHSPFHAQLSVGILGLLLTTGGLIRLLFRRTAT